MKTRFFAPNRKLALKILPRETILLDLFTRYKNDADFALQAKIIIPLASFPIDGLEQVVDNSAGHIPDELQPLLDWFEDIYVIRQNRRCDNRINNYTEAAHRRLKAELGMAHATIWKLIESLRKVQHARDLFYEQLVAASVPIDGLEQVVDNSAGHIPDELQPLLDWFEDIYVIRQNRRCDNRINNYTEAAHRRLKAELGMAHATIWKLIESLRKVQHARDLFYEQLVAGPCAQEIPHVNRFKRLCFGLSCSPFLAMCVIRHHARKYQNEFPETVNKILENICVDDLVLMKKDDPQRW
ncbi:hypothetical protein T07_662 [Trichinella nelsoni]|uniref:Uncharacterized protein n=1 Tax=Trichinella nelsoni TaxID=6336 RepID=A0A0V0SF82_9BILA|nr:hypothetical protein T07_662 [Trichinella nelsoni]